MGILVLLLLERQPVDSESDLAPHSSTRLVYTEATREGQGLLCLPRYSSTSNTESIEVKY